MFFDFFECFSHNNLINKNFDIYVREIFYIKKPKNEGDRNGKFKKCFKKL